MELVRGTSYGLTTKKIQPTVVIPAKMSLPPDSGNRDLYDYLSFRHNNKLKRYLDTVGDHIDCKIYSDMIARINSYNQRKIKSFLITSKYIFIFEPSYSI